MQNRKVFVAPLLAFNFVFLLLVIIAIGFATTPKHEALQWQFGLYCVALSAVFAFPFLVAEYALAKRSKMLPFQAYTQLTRDADVSTKWRILAWSGVLLMSVLAGGMMIYGSTLLLGQDVLHIRSYTVAWSIGLACFVVAVLALSFVPRTILLLLATVCSVIVAIAGFVDDDSWVLLTTGNSVLWCGFFLAFLSSGFGIGMYWQHWHKTEQSVFQAVIPVFMAQVAAIVLSVLMSGVDILNPAQGIPLGLSGVLMAAVLLHMTREQLQTRFSRKTATIISMVPALLCALCVISLSTNVAYFEIMLYIFWVALAFYLIAPLILVLHAFGFSIFVGWKMKISHLRKAIQFPNELIYNLWRVAIRFIMLLVCIGIALAPYCL